MSKLVFSRLTIKGKWQMWQCNIWANLTNRQVIGVENFNIQQTTSALTDEQQQQFLSRYPKVKKEKKSRNSTLIGQSSMTESPMTYYKPDSLESTCPILEGQHVHYTGGSRVAESGSQKNELRATLSNKAVMPHKWLPLFRIKSSLFSINFQIGLKYIKK